MAKLELSDEQLVTKTLEDIDYFGELLARYEKKIIRFIIRISSFEQAEAEEIAQETFIKAWRNLQGFSGSSSFATWLMAIARNETISHHRKSNSRPDLKESIEELKSYQYLVSKVDLEAELESKLTAEKVLTILSHLSVKHREVLVLKFLEEKSTKEVSEIIKKPEKTVSTLIHRGKKEFKKVGNRLNYFT
jgi:RNA polymerase sigma-70 factor (ECF subfamily)